MGSPIPRVCHIEVIHIPPHQIGLRLLMIGKAVAWLIHNMHRTQQRSSNLPQRPPYAPASPYACRVIRILHAASLSVPLWYSGGCYQGSVRL